MKKIVRTSSLVFVEQRSFSSARTDGAFNRAISFARKPAPDLNNYIERAGPRRRKVKIRMGWGRTAVAAKVAESTGRRGREKVADIKRKQSRCDLTWHSGRSFETRARPALRIVPRQRVMAMAGICKSVIAVVYARRIWTSGRRVAEQRCSATCLQIWPTSSEGRAHDLSEAKHVSQWHRAPKRSSSIKERRWKRRWDESGMRVQQNDIPL